jgi:chromosome segregation ATPase
LNSEQDPGEVEVPVDEVSRVETILRDLWEKLRSSARILHELREERNALREKVTYLEQELENHKVGLQKREQEIKSLRAEHLQLVNSNGKNALTEEEREFLKTKIRDLIVKINSYL